MLVREVIDLKKVTIVEMSHQERPSGIITNKPKHVLIDTMALCLCSDMIDNLEQL